LLRSFFIGLSTNKHVRAFAERSTAGNRLASRFVAGTSIEDAVAAARRLNDEGIDVTIDALGESVLQVAQAEESAAVYNRLLDAIESNHLRAHISLKLSQMGIDIGGPGAGPELAERIVGELIEHASRIGSFVRIDMEDSGHTEATLTMTERLHARYPNAVGTVLQSYLFRTEQDLDRMLAQGIRIRLCKGAYREPPTVAYAGKTYTDASYVRLMKTMVTSGVYCGIATHDEKIIDKMRRFVEEHGIAKDRFEFQMLYGVRRDLQRALVAEGFRMRVYLPFGAEWFPYFMRRLAERPANALFVAKNLFRT
jgi:proline dehydrogenase